MGVWRGGEGRGLPPQQLLTPFSELMLNTIWCLVSCYQAIYNCIPLATMGFFSRAGQAVAPNRATLRLCHLCHSTATG